MMTQHRTQRTGVRTWIVLAAISVAGIGMASLGGCKSNPPPATQIITGGTSGMSDSEQQYVDLAKGQKLQVRLKATPSTTWRMGGSDFGGDVVEVIDHKTEAEGTEGGPWDLFNLQAKKPGQSHLEFVSQSADRSMPVKRVKLDVTVH
jgi:hypothetical protein